MKQFARAVLSGTAAALALAGSVFAGNASADISAQACTQPGVAGNGRITQQTLTNGVNGCTVYRIISWHNYHSPQGDYIGFFNVFGPNGTIAVSQTKLWSTEESFRAEVNQTAGSGRLWCSEFWRKNSDGSFTRTADPACSSV